jgi:hypothetical protein
MTHEKTQRPRGAALLAMQGTLLLFCVAAARAGAPADFRESGEYRIYTGGKEIGTEKYVIIASGDTVSTTSTLDFRNPGESHQRVHLETSLEASGRFVPRSYTLKSDVEGKKGTIVGEFGPNQAMFGYVNADAPPRKEGQLVGDEYTVLDTNIFHHFIFLARLFKFDSERGKPQRLQVVIPQEDETGFLDITDTGKESLQVGRKKIEVRRLQLDSGSMQIQVWVDNQRIVHKIAVPARGIEVVRNP